MAKKTSRVARRTVASRRQVKLGPATTTEPACFLARETFGLPRYRLAAMAVAFALMLASQGVFKTLGSYANRSEEWFSAGAAGARLLAGFEDRSPREPSLVVSLEGDAAGTPEKLLLLQRKLRETKDPRGGWSWFPAVNRGAEPTLLLAAPDQRLVRDSERMRAALESVRDLADRECGVPLAAIRLGGAPVIQVALHDEGKRSAAIIACLAVAGGAIVTYLGLQSLTLTALATGTAALCAVVSLSLAYWLGGLGVAAGADALTLLAPTVVFAAALAGAYRLLHDYLIERRSAVASGAAERALQAAFAPSLGGIVVLAGGLGLLSMSDALPLQRFGIHTALGLVAGQLLLSVIVPVVLHRFPPLVLPQVAPPIAVRTAAKGSGSWGAIGLGLIAGAIGVALGLPSAMATAVTDWSIAPLSWGLALATAFAAGQFLEGALRYFTAFRQAVASGISPVRAVHVAWDRRRATTTQSALLVGAVLAALVLSPITTAQQLGLLAAPLMVLAVAGELALLPASLGGLVNWSEAKPAAKRAHARQMPEPEKPLPMAPPKPVFVEEPAEASAAVMPVIHRPDEPEALSPANAALRSKLQRLRRQATGGR